MVSIGLCVTRLYSEMSVCPVDSPYSEMVVCPMDHLYSEMSVSPMDRLYHEMSICPLEIVQTEMSACLQCINGFQETYKYLTANGYHRALAKYGHCTALTASRGSWGHIG